MSEHEEPHHPEDNQEHEHEPEHSQGAEEIIPDEIPPLPSGGEQPEGENIGVFSNSNCTSKPSQTVILTK